MPQQRGVIRSICTTLTCRVLAVAFVGSLVACTSNADSVSTTPESTGAGTVTTRLEATTTETTATTASTTASTTPVTTATTALPTTTTTATSKGPPTYVDENGFDDHTVPSVRTVDDLDALSRSGVGGQSAVKFTIPNFDKPLGASASARVHLMDSNFYALHDEWFYFRLLNGQHIPGIDIAPFNGRRFPTIDEIYRWASAMPEADLPLDLTFIEDRLYATDFYDLALDEIPRKIGAGSIVRIADPVAGRADHWLLELEFTDTVTPEIVAQFFLRLQPVLPAEVAVALEWVVRSPQQEQIAQRMEADRLPYHDRIVRFGELVPTGTVAVYNEGVAAGRLLYVGEGGAALGDATSTDIVITEHVPDWLPPASAMITSDPQTPLAHINLLARNRGIPNASQAGIHDDAGLLQAARVHAYAIVITRGSTMRIALISAEQYDEWADRQIPTPIAVPPVDVADMPLVVDLADLVAQLSADGLTEADIAAWTSALGGKSAGFLTLLSTPGLTPPPDPLAITIRPYIEHIAPIRSTLAASITNREVVKDPRARWLILEGTEDYAVRFPSDRDSAFADEFTSTNPPGTAVGVVLAAGGIRALIESSAIDPETLQVITTELERTYASYNVSAGLRFRSSSSVEDIEGFNGAGLYTSYTGYLQPEQLDEEDDRDNTVERAILRAWGSYWSFEAFEERSLAKIDHLSGAMGLTVHARFDDDLERNNGVATFSFLRGGGADDAVVEINVQAGAVAVTNPDPNDVELPEIIRMTRSNGMISIERLAGSTIVEADEQVLDDAAAYELFGQIASVAALWRTRLNESLLEPQRVQTVVLDFEFKTMEPGWPRLDDGLTPYPARLIVRQVRSLDPGLRELPSSVRELAVPRDVLTRAALVATVRCSLPGVAATEHIEVLTDPLLVPDMGFAEQPLIIGPVPSATATCSRVVHYSSPRQALVGLVDSGGAFVIIG